MNRIIIDVNNEYDRIAVVEDGEVVELIYENNYLKSLVGNIYVGRVENILKGMQAVFVNIGKNKNAYLYYGKKRATNDDEGVSPYKVGDNILVQVEKDSDGKKGAVVTQKISFSGKFIILIPNDFSIGISQKITKIEERKRIHSVIEEVIPKNYGIIVRTQGEGRTKEEFQEEINYLYNVAENVILKGKYEKAPSLIYDDAYLRTIRELFNNDIDEIIINSLDKYNFILESFKQNNLDFTKVKFYNLKIPIFSEYMIESQTQKAFEKKVWLKSGGFIIIEQTEALVVIDVNTGKYVGKRNLQSTFMKTNLEAAQEIAKQLRLRNLSGIIIVDFIDINDEDDKVILLKTLENAVNKDKIKTVVIGITELGLVQITRQKKRGNLLQQATKKCKYCHGRGFTTFKSEEENF